MIMLSNAVEGMPTDFIVEVVNLLQEWWFEVWDGFIV